MGILVLLLITVALLRPDVASVPCSEPCRRPVASRSLAGPLALGVRRPHITSLTCQAPPILQPHEGFTQAPSQGSPENALEVAERSCPAVDQPCPRSDHAAPRRTGRPSSQDEDERAVCALPKSPAWRAVAASAGTARPAGLRVDPRLAAWPAASGRSGASSAVGSCRCECGNRTRRVGRRPRRSR